MSNEELVVAVRSGKADFVDLWRSMRGLIHKIAYKYGDKAEHDDLVQESFFGLRRAVNLWNPDAESSFVRYAYFWIRQSMLRYVQDCGRSIRVPAYQQGRLFKYRRMLTEYQRDFNRLPSDRELCVALDINEEQLQQLKADDLTMETASLDVLVSEYQDTTLGDLVPDESVDVEGVAVDQVQQEQLQRVLWNVVELLEPKQAAVIKYRYKEGLTLKAAGDQIGVTPEAVRQIEKKALKAMRKRSIRRQLEPYVDEVRYSAGVRNTGVNTYARTRTSSTEKAAIKAAQYLKYLEKQGLL